MVHQTLSKRIWSFTRLMLIYGNTPKDIMAMIWRRRYRFVSVFAVIVIAVMLTGCGKAGDKKIELKALDQFWERLATGKNSTGVE